MNEIERIAIENDRDPHSNEPNGRDFLFYNHSSCTTAHRHTLCVSRLIFSKYSKDAYIHLLTEFVASLSTADSDSDTSRALLSLRPFNATHPASTKWREARVESIFARNAAISQHSIITLSPRENAAKNCFYRLDY